VRINYGGLLLGINLMFHVKHDRTLFHVKHRWQQISWRLYIAYQFDAPYRKRPWQKS
jgi:hypothetical protein